MTIKYHRELVQGSEEWAAARCGLLTASEMKLILTPTLKVANNDKVRAHVWELLAQRITRYVEPTYDGWNILRGREDEIEARAVYAQNYAAVEEVGFITNDEWGFTIGYSPDGLIGDDGLIECKSRIQKYQIETITNGIIPDEFVFQCQTGLLVTKRKWLDFNSFSGGLPMKTIRTEPDPVIQAAIVQAATEFEVRVAELMAKYKAVIAENDRLVPIERRITQEMYV